MESAYDGAPRHLDLVAQTSMYAIVHHSKGIVQNRTKPATPNGWRTVTAEAAQMAVLAHTPKLAATLRVKSI
jgi:hypothetical protein